MPRPSSIALSIVAKLSSVKIISAACRATSVPPFPIAIPISADLSAGASFTPSPVIAVTHPARFKARTIRTLCSGDTRAKTDTEPIRSSRAPSSSVSSCAPVMHSSRRLAIPSCLAIASAVSA